jgi:NADH:ubiquinone oxidoreductase subunit E
MASSLSKTTDDTDEIIEEILRSYPPEPSLLIGVLQDIQRDCRHLPRAALVRVGEHLGVPLSQVYRVATFYTTFSFVPRGEHVLRVCDGTACHLKGSELVAEAVNRLLGIGPGETTEDGLFTLETVHCLGACALAPVMMVGGRYHPHLDMDKVARIIDAYAGGQTTWQS